jgi:hypothetical protein
MANMEVYLLRICHGELNHLYMFLNIEYIQDGYTMAKEVIIGEVLSKVKKLNYLKILKIVLRDILIYTSQV